MFMVVTTSITSITTPWFTSHFWWFQRCQLRRATTSTLPGPSPSKCLLWLDSTSRPGAELQAGPGAPVLVSWGYITSASIQYNCVICPPYLWWPYMTIYINWKLMPYYLFHLAMVICPVSRHPQSQMPQNWGPGTYQELMRVFPV